MRSLDKQPVCCKTNNLVSFHQYASIQPMQFVSIHHQIDLFHSFSLPSEKQHTIEAAMHIPNHSRLPIDFFDAPLESAAHDHHHCSGVHFWKVIGCFPLVWYHYWFLLLHIRREEVGVCGRCAFLLRTTGGVQRTQDVIRFSLSRMVSLPGRNWLCSPGHLRGRVIIHSLSMVST
jgi:hypothetical protein